MAKLPNNISDREMQKFIKVPGASAVLTVDANRASTIFGESLTAQRNALYSVSSAVPSVSQLRNNTDTANGGTVEVVNGEYNLSVADQNAFALLESSQRGRYKPGYISQAGLGVRLTEVFNEGDYAKWGYYQGSDGFYFGQDSGGLYIGVKRSNVEIHKKYQADWNRDTLLGTNGDKNNSGLSIDMTDGHIYQINFAWYGYGPVEFQVLMKDRSYDKGQRPVTIHIYESTGETTIAQPNLFISAELFSATGNEYNLYVAGRQFSTFGANEAEGRLVGAFRIGVSTTTVFRPLISWRKKTDQVFDAQEVRTRSVQLLSVPDLIYGFIVNGTLTGANFVNPSGYDQDETVCQVDISATAISGGQFIGPIDLAKGGQGNRSEISKDADFDYVLKNNDVLTLVARTVAGTDNIVACSFNIVEEW
jgi:hypothetical protein